MAINATIPGDCLLAVENCIDVCLTTDEYELTECSVAGFLFSFYFLNNENGVGSFEFLGQTFTVDNSQPFTPNTWAWGTDPDVTSQNFFNMLSSNFAIAQDVIITLVDFPPIMLITLEWRECKPVDFQFIQQDLNPGILTSALQPVIESVNEGYQLAYQLYSKTLDQYITELQTLTPKNSEFCFQAQHVLSGYVTSKLPCASEAAQIQVDPNFKHEFCIRYGSIVNKDCETTFGQFYESEVMKVANVARQALDRDPYPCYDGVTLELPTKRPDNFICKDQNEWVTVCLDLNKAINENTNFTISYIVRYTDLDTNAVTDNPFTEDNVYIIPTGSGNTGYENYSVEVVGVINFNAGGSAEFPIYAPREYRVIDCGCCQEHIELYFLSACSGGFETIRFDCLESLDLQSTSTELCIETACRNESFEERLKAGSKTQIAHDNLELINFETYICYSEEALAWVKEYKFSSEVYAKTQDSNGDDVFQRFLLVPDTQKISLEDGDIKVTGKGYFSFKHNTQSV